MNKYTTRVAELGGEFFKTDQSPIHLTEAQLNEFEQKLGHPLPADYREFLRDFGGYSFNAFYPVQSEHGFLERGSIGVTFGPNAGTHDALALYKHYGKVTALTPELLPIAEADSDLVCLALSGPKQGQILHWLYESDEPTPILYFIADTFDEFMQILTKYEDD